MPSSLAGHGREEPVAKRQKLNRADAPRRTPQESRIFAPFRVCSVFMLWRRKLLIILDNWSSIIYSRSFHLNPSWQDHLPNHHVSGKMSPNIRSQARTQSCFPYSTTDARGYNCVPGMERPSFCSMGRGRNFARHLGIQAGQENCRAEDARRFKSIC